MKTGLTITRSLPYLLKTSTRLWMKIAVDLSHAFYLNQTPFNPQATNYSHIRSRNLGFKQNLVKSKACSNIFVLKYLRSFNGPDDLYSNNNKSAKRSKPHMTHTKENHKHITQAPNLIITYKSKLI